MYIVKTDYKKQLSSKHENNEYKLNLISLFSVTVCGIRLR